MEFEAAQHIQIDLYIDHLYNQMLKKCNYTCKKQICYNCINSRYKFEGL